MADWDHFAINETGKATITYKENNVKKYIKLDLLTLPDGDYFLDKKSINVINECTPEELAKSEEYKIYSKTGATADERWGIVSRVTDIKRLEKILQEIKALPLPKV